MASAGTPVDGCTAEAESAISALRLSTTDGAGDIPEALFTAVHRTALGRDAGDWRPGPDVARHIILMGDAAGVDPEPWASPKTLRDAVEALNSNGVSLQAVHVGTDNQAKFDYTALAAGSGGKAVSSANSSDAASLIEGIFADIETGRFPVASTVIAKPTFRYAPPGGGVGGASVPSRLTVELETYDTKRQGWRSYRKFKVSDFTAQSFEVTKALPPGSYRWRLSGSSRSGQSVLPDGSFAQLVDKGRFVEEQYIAFDRVANAPRSIRKITPTMQTAADRTHPLDFSDDISAEAFGVRLTNAKTQKQKTVIIKRDRTLSGAQPQNFRVYVRTKPGETFRWEIQGLNDDRKKVDPLAWN